MIVNNLSKNINGIDILDKISFILNKGSKVGLVGKNGSGKSTLLKILSGNLDLDQGEINLNNQSIKMLKQEISKEDYNYSIVDYVKKENNILLLEKKLHKLETDLNDENMLEYGNILDEYLRIDGYNFEQNLNFILEGLNFKVNLNNKINTLSGGEKIKVLLATLLLSNADIILLDEPTNNLDLDSIKWLENYLSNLDKEMIIVSHDKDFLNKIVNKIFEIENGKIIEYNLSYSDYLNYKDILYNQELEKYEKAKDEQKRIKSKIEEAKKWMNKGLNSNKKDNDKIAANFSKERTKKTAIKASKLVKELEKIKIDSEFRKRENIIFNIDYSEVKGNGDIYIEDLICGYNNFKTPSIRIDIPFGTRVLISGKNGSGKTTFIKTIIKEKKPLSGAIYIGRDVKIGYISQDTLDDKDNLSIKDYLMKDSDIEESKLFKILDKFHIKYDDKDKLYLELSPGERTRINLAKLAINKINTLILDESTNHLDKEGIDMLKDVINSFEGTIISVSHNRDFNENLNNDVTLNIEDGTLVYKDKKVKLKKM